MVGWSAGLSYETRIQNMYQTIPKLPAAHGEKTRTVKKSNTQKRKVLLSFQDHKPTIYVEDRRPAWVRTNIPANGMATTAPAYEPETRVFTAFILGIIC